MLDVAWRERRKHVSSKLMYGVKARSLMAVGYALLIGCGARTESFDDELGPGGAAGSSAGAPTAGSPSGGGASAGTSSGGSANSSGSFPTSGSSGSFPTSGSGGTSSGGTGAAPSGGSFPTAGSGAVSSGGFGGISSAGSGGFGASGGSLSGGSGGLEEICNALGTSTCEQCVCNRCATPITTCFSNIGCALIFACAQQTGCTGFSCYSPNTCRPVIDQFGGLTGQSMQHVLSLSACALTANNACGCN